MGEGRRTKIRKGAGEGNADAGKGTSKVEDKRRGKGER